MKITIRQILSVLVIMFLIGGACSSGKNSLEQGNYYDAVLTAINRLRRNSDNKKSSETLRSAYPLAVKYYDDRANNAMTSNSPTKWREVVQNYNTIQSMYDEIQRSPGALQVIPNPANYQSKITEAKKNAADESYQAGVMALAGTTRADAKKAYYLFVDCNNYVPGYKDVAEMMEKAKMVATVKVAVEPIPVTARNYAINAEYFDNKLNEYLQKNNGNEFVKFYRVADVIKQRITPDHIIQLSFDEFSIGQVYMNEKESQVEKDSVVLAYTYTDTKGTLLRKEIEPVKIVPPANLINTNTTNTNTNTTNTNTTNTNTNTNTTNTNTTNANTETKTSENKTDVTKQEDKKEEEAKTEEKKNEQKSENESGEKKDEKGTSGNNSSNTKEEMVTICHQPPGKPSERKTLSVPASAVKAHIAHGDVMGECKSDNKSDDKNKGNSNDKSKGNGNGGGMASLFNEHNSQIMIASASDNWLSYFEKFDNVVDTTKIYGKVKATVRHFRKTVTSRGVLNFRIIDAKTKSVISEERMPSEFIWVSEWLTYNGDSRALTQEQLNLAKQRELPQPANQDLFGEFTKPLFNQVTQKISQYYRNY